MHSKDFGFRLKTSLDAYDMSTSELVAVLGLKSKGNVSSWMIGDSAPAYDILRRLVTVLGISTDWIMGLSESMYTEASVCNIEAYVRQTLSSDIEIYESIFSEYFDICNRQQYTLAERAHIAVLMFLVRPKCFRLYVEYKRCGYKTRGILAKLRSELSDNVKPTTREIKRCEEIIILIMGK